MHFARSKKAWLFTLALLAGVCVGAGSDEAFHAVRNRRSKAGDQDSEEVFQRRLRCKTAADDYVRRSSDENSTLVLEKVDFGPARRSCVGSFTRITAGKRAEIWSYETIDI